MKKYKLNNTTIYIVPKWLMPFGYGLALYNTILIRKDGNINKLIAHEYCHTQQWKKVGFFKFPFVYLKELLLEGYLYNKYEIEARKYAEIHYKDL